VTPAASAVRLPSKVCAGRPFPLRGKRSWCQLVQVARASRLSVGCCSLPFATSVLPHRHRCLAARTQTERLTEHFIEPLDRPTPSSPSTRRTPSRPCLPTLPPFHTTRCQAAFHSDLMNRSGLPSLGLSGAPPPACPLASTPPELSPGFGPRHGSRSSRSAPVVSHHFDGLLRSVGSEPIAARYRTWGSLGFWRARRCRPKTTRTRSAFPPALHPTKVYSSSVAVPHRWGLLPPDHSSRNDVATARQTNPRRRKGAPLRVAERKSLFDA
jgi:hypothetical protein